MSTNYEAEQAIRDHRLQPRIRSSDGPPCEDFECLCGEMFWGVAEWSEHAAERVLSAGPDRAYPSGPTTEERP